MKMISAQKVTVAKLLANQEVNNLIQALGLECDMKTAKLVYDPEKLRYGKIIAASDADADGDAIENLLFNILWFICPELFLNGHVYSAEPALFRVTTKKNEYIYLRDQEALDAYKAKNDSKIQFIGRNKGLGESDAHELEETLLNPQTRNIVQLSVSDIEKTDELFDIMYGKAVNPRVEYLNEHLKEANVD